MTPMNADAAIPRQPRRRSAPLTTIAPGICLGATPPIRLETKAVLPRVLDGLAKRHAIVDGSHPHCLGGSCVEAVAGEVCPRVLSQSDIVIHSLNPQRLQKPLQPILARDDSATKSVNPKLVDRGPAVQSCTAATDADSWYGSPTVNRRNKRRASDACRVNPGAPR
jgi:hypothetical protein